MIRNYAKFAAAAVLAGLLSACSVPERLDSPPALQAEAAEGETKVQVPTRLTTYNWGGEMTYGGPEEAFEGEAGIKVAAGAAIQLSFDGKEPDEITVRQIKDSPPPAEMKSEEGRFVVHEEPGTYLYGIYGDWPEGSALYGIKVTVE